MLVPFIFTQIVSIALVIFTSFLATFSLVCSQQQLPNYLNKTMFILDFLLQIILPRSLFFVQKYKKKNGKTKFRNILAIEKSSLTCQHKMLFFLVKKKLKPLLFGFWKGSFFFVGLFELKFIQKAFQYFLQTNLFMFLSF